MLQGYQVKEHIEANYPELTGRIYPAFTTKIDQLSVVYIISTSSGGVVGQDALELRIIHSDYDEAEAYKRKLCAIFSTEKTNQAVVLPSISFTGSLSGGGFLFRDDLQMWELTAFFILKTKERA
ncbi:hypothetical protein [Enterococcus sp. LJL90]